MSLSTHQEIEAQNLDELVLRLQLWYQYGPPNRATTSPFLEVYDLRNEGIAPESRLQRALAKLHSEKLIRQESKPMLPPEPQDEYSAPYPFATHGEYRQALRHKSRALIHELRKALENSHLVID